MPHRSNNGVRSLILALGCALFSGNLLAAGAPTVAPTFSLKTPSGESVNYPADAKGRPTVLLFWPSWCPFSRALQPYVQAIWEDYRDAGVNVWTINIKEDGDPVQAMKDRGLSFPLLLNGDPLVDTYRIRYTPWFVIMDGDNNIRYTRPPKPGTPIVVAKAARETLNSMLGSKAVPLPDSYPKPYDLHLKKASDLVDRTRPVKLSQSYWQPWISDYLRNIPKSEKRSDLPATGAVKNGKAAIALARKNWSSEFSEEVSNLQAPYRAYGMGGHWIVLGDGLESQLGTGLIFVVERSTGQVVRVADGRNP